MFNQKVIQKIGLFFGLLNVFGCSICAPKQPTLTAQTRYCPAITQISKNANHHWGTPDGNFQSFQTSFAVTLDQFIGAQWQGANLGYVTCVYKPHNPNLFFVTLLYNQLTYQPDTRNTLWVKDKKGSWFNCHSEKPSDCPFVIRPQQKKHNIYQEAERLKEETNPNEDAGF